MKAVVIIPPVFDFYYTPHRSSGLGGEIVLRILRENGLEARLLNYPGRGNKKVKNQSIPPVLDYVRPFLIEHETGKTSFFNQYKRFGPPPDECARQALATRPDLVFISCFAFCYAQATLDIAENIRQSDPRPMIIAGGAGVSALPSFFLDDAAVDYALVGEAEVSLPAFLDVLLSGSRNYDRVPNLFQKKQGQVISPGQFGRTDSGDIGFVLKKTFETSRAVYYSTMLSRGCPKSCRFCSNFITHGRKFRTIPVEKIRAFLERMSPSGKPSAKQVYVNFEDDNFLWDPAYFFSVLDVFKTFFPGAGFLAENGIDYTLITPETLIKLIRYGMKQFNLSMVSVDEQMLEHEKRKVNLEQYESTIRILQKYEIPCITYFICGLKHDTREKVVETICYLAGQPTRIGISLFYPVPGIPDFTDKALFSDIHPCLCAGASAYPWNQSLTTGELVTAFRLSRLVNLIKFDKRTDIDDLMIERTISERMLFTLVKKGKNIELIPVPNMDEKMMDQFFRNLPAGMAE